MSAFGLEVIAACGVGLLIRWWRPAAAPVAALVLSCGVVAVWQPLAFAATIALTGIAWLAIRDSRDHRVRHLVIVALVLTLFAVRYASWPGLVAPLGLSYTVFRLVGAILDSAAVKNLRPRPRDVFLLSLFFPTFRAGPLTTLTSLRPGLPLLWRTSGGRILRGLVRKVLLADTLNAFVLRPWMDGGIDALSRGQCVLLPPLLGLHIYWDFAGYSDIAIGSAALIGYEVPENFRQPFLSRNLVEFWQRWHITLSEWIRTRVFVKIIGRRAAASQLRAATIVSMALCGIWHGPGLHFLLWGLWHGVGLVVVHAFRSHFRRAGPHPSEAGSVARTALAAALTFSYVSAGWILFTMPTDDARRFFIRSIGAPHGDEGLAAATLVLLSGAAWLSPTISVIWNRVPPIARGMAWAASAAGVAYFTLCREGLGSGFMYAQF